LAQAFGRLIRREGDKGTFVILSAAMPSRLLRAFPAGVPVSRVPLDEAIERVRSTLGRRGGESIAQRGREAVSDRD
jgi:ATP-dependent DNA helicase DinG